LPLLLLHQPHPLTELQVLNEFYVEQFNLLGIKLSRLFIRLTLDGIINPGVATGWYYSYL